MARKKKVDEYIEVPGDEAEAKPQYKDYDVFTEEVAKAVKENRVLKVGRKWRVFG